ncbi:hypothetical protein HJC23_012950 [Cyclotella cryptica]|uniref:Uncharacterized protein n=1 Tax=Cyclotella cryptica TaxID=29204 RepID=A0ABD3Q216_9STRA
MSNRYHPTAGSFQWGPPAVSLAALYGDEFGDNDDVGAAVAVEPRRAITFSGITRNNRIPLRQWIKGALNASGRDLGAGASSSYIASSMKIAIHLAKQISQAEELARFGLFRGLDVLPIGAGVDWAEYVVVCLKANGQCGVANSRLLRQQEEQQKQGSSFAGNAAARDEDADLKAFLSSCGVDEYEGAANGPGSSLCPGAGTLEKTPFYNGGNRGDAPPACMTGEIAEAVEKSCAILSRLGEDMPSNLTKETLGQHIENTQLMIRGLSESDLLNYRLMTDTTKLISMKFLAKMLGLALMVNPNFHAFVTLKMLQLTISHGLSPVSPIAFCYFGALLAKLGDLRVGYRFTVLAKTLLDKLESQEVAGEVLGVTTEMLCFIEPLQASNELRSQGENAAMASGDFHFACISRLKYCSTLFWSGRSLSDAKDALSRASRFMKEHGHKTCLVFLIPIERTILTLMGANKETHISSDNRNPRQLMQLSFHNMFLSFMLHKCNLKESTEKFFESERNSWFLFVADTRHALIAGLASFHIYREKRELLWAERGRRCKLDLKLWAEQGSLWNFQHLFLLLDAEEHYSCNDDFENAKASYNGAIGLAKSHNFIYDEALSYELAANFYLNNGKLVTSLEYFRLAHEKYHEWGARAKADKLFEFTREKFVSMFDAHGCQILNPLVDSSVLSPQSPDESDTRKRQLQNQN